MTAPRRPARAVATTSAALIACALGVTACASAGDVEARGQALEARLDPVRVNHCPPEPLARGLAEVAFARAASRRGDPIAADAHLAAALRWAEAAEAAPCVAPAPPERPPLRVDPDPPPPAPADLDADGVPDATDPDDDGDGASDIVDQCPREPEDLDGFEDIDGCPEPGGTPAPGAP